MGNIWFTSDTHFCHNKPFIYTPRNASSTEEMSERIVEQWNKVVGIEDTVYFLGDIALNDTTAAVEYIKRLQGNIIWFLGNHDSPKRVEEVLNKCSNIRVHKHRYATTLRFTVNGQELTFYISHYPTLTANFDDKHFSRHVFSVHGHTHQSGNWMDLNNPFLYHVGVDSHNLAPVHIEEIVADIKNRWNELGLNTPILNSDNLFTVPKERG